MMMTREKITKRGGKCTYKLTSIQDSLNNPCNKGGAVQLGELLWDRDEPTNYWIIIRDHVYEKGGRGGEMSDGMITM